MNLNLSCLIDEKKIKWIPVLIYIIVFVVLSILFYYIFLFDSNRGEDVLVESLLSVSTSTTVFYIGWGDGSFARKCKIESSECDFVHSFTETEAVDLPYASFDDLPYWIDMSKYCEEECFVKKSVFSTDPNTSTIIADWENRAALIICDDDNFGSGLLTWSEAQPAIVTAKHVIDGMKLCKVFLPRQGYKEVNNNSFRIHKNLDLGIILLGEYNNNVVTLAKEPINVCEGGLTGEEIKFIGYPEQIIQPFLDREIKSPSADGGEISNQNNEKYLLTDDIGHGYSGGIAIKKESGCYLGVPLGVMQGTDRIGDVGVILKGTNLKYNTAKGFEF